MIFTRRTWKDRAAYHACSGASAVETEKTEVNYGTLAHTLTSERHQNREAKSRDFPYP